jgi:hypothetical protein
MGRDLIKNPSERTLYQRKWFKTEKGEEYQERKRKYMVEWRKKNREKSKAIQKRSYDKARFEALCHYGGNPPKCKCCGEKMIEFLTLDHIDGKGAEHRRLIEKEYGWKIGGNQLVFWLKRKNYPKGFQVLCANCNFGKRTNKECPHKLQGK